MPVNRQKHLQGFTLLEVLVALSILAMSYGVILQIFGGAAQKASLTGDYRRAMIIAESQLDYAAVNVGYVDVVNEGTSGKKFAWQVSVASADEYLIEGLPARYTPVVIRVDVSWESTAGKSRSVTVSTIRLRRGRAG